jgi:hypothetical protein
MNRGIYDKFKCPDIGPIIKARSLEWLGHGLRMDGTRTVKTLLKAKQERGEKSNTG